MPKNISESSPGIIPPAIGPRVRRGMMLIGSSGCRTDASKQTLVKNGVIRLSPKRKVGTLGSSTPRRPPLSRHSSPRFGLPHPCKGTPP